MMERLWWRGPDAQGLHFEPEAGLALGHRRLAIVDLVDGAQPMHLADGSLSVVFNGEIYNHGELRQRLEAAGHRFFTDHSDTEVLLHGYRQWGRELPQHLQGMWAFAIRDRQGKELFCSRDRFGKKPFFYFSRGGEFAFASELRALLAHPAAPRDFSELARVKYLAHSFLPCPHTPYSGIFQLPPGHNLIVKDGEAPALQRYWQYELEPDQTKSESSWVEELRETLRGAVRRRLMVDVPLGIFLSGGIDSSTVAALAAEILGGDALQTFTIGFTEASFDESRPARQMAGFLGSQHHEEILDLDRAATCLPEIFDRLDQPQGDASLLPTWLLGRFARRRVTVALGGDGGDELFAGYDPFRALRYAEWYARLVPRPIHGGLRLLASMLPTAHHNLSLDFKIKRTLRGLSHPSSRWNPVWLGALEPDELQRVTGTKFSVEEIYSEAMQAWESAPGGSSVDRTLQFFTRLYLPDGILAKADRASMMNSLEVRSPFLDFEVAELARRLPHHFKLRNGETKYLLKRAVRGLIPDELIDRKKKGFGVPVGAWLRTSRLQPILPTARSRELLAHHQAGRSDERLYLWSELVWQEWLRRQPPASP